MQLHHLLKLNSKTKRRIGRGGKRGSYSGRGVKGQKSRAGRRIRPAVRDLILRLPKKRGFRNKPKSEKPAIFNLKDLSLLLKTRFQGTPVALNKRFFAEAGLLPKNFSGRVKILGKGDISVPVRVEGISVSKSAKTKIEKAGGRVENESR